MRCLAAALVMLVLSPAARAVPITGYAVGRVTQVIVPRDPSPYRVFTVGELLYMQFTYDSANATAVADGFQMLGASYRLATYGSNFRFSGWGGVLVATDAATDRVALGFSDWLGMIDLTFTDPTGAAITSTAVPTLADLGRFPFIELRYGSEFIWGGQSFVADLILVPGLPPEPLPEPSTLALGLGGAALAGLGWKRRRAHPRHPPHADVDQPQGQGGRLGRTSQLPPSCRSMNR